MKYFTLSPIVETIRANKAQRYQFSLTKYTLQKLFSIKSVCKNNLSDTLILLKLTIMFTPATRFKMYGCQERSNVQNITSVSSIVFILWRSVAGRDEAY